MPDKIKKFLRKLTDKQLAYLLPFIDRVETYNLEGLNIKPLQGHNKHFRVKAGRYRIIFIQHNQGNQIVSITRRNDQTYRDF